MQAPEKNIAITAKRVNFTHLRSFRRYPHIASHQDTMSEAGQESTDIKSDTSRPDHDGRDQLLEGLADDSKPYLNDSQNENVTEHLNAIFQLVVPLLSPEDFAATDASGKLQSYTQSVLGPATSEPSLSAQLFEVRDFGSLDNPRPEESIEPLPSPKVQIPSAIEIPGLDDEVSMRQLPSTLEYLTALESAKADILDNRTSANPLVHIAADSSQSTVPSALKPPSDAAVPIQLYYPSDTFLEHTTVPVKLSASVVLSEAPSGTTLPANIESPPQQSRRPTTQQSFLPVALRNRLRDSRAGTQDRRWNGTQVPSRMATAPEGATRRQNIWDSEDALLGQTSESNDVQMRGLEVAPRRASSAPKPRPSGSAIKVKRGRAITVLTKSGLSLEVREDEAPYPGNNLKEVLATNVNPLRHPLPPPPPPLESNSTMGYHDRKFDTTPVLPALDRREVPAWFAIRYPAEPLGVPRLVRPKSTRSYSAAYKAPEDDGPHAENLSYYSRPLPITRACSAPPRKPTRRHHLLRDLRQQREMGLQEIYLGPTAINAKRFLKHVAAIQMSTHLATPNLQTLNPTFNLVHPSHQTYSLLGRVHWQEADDDLPRCHSPQSHLEGAPRSKSRERTGRAESAARNKNIDPLARKPKLIPHQVRRVKTPVPPASAIPAQRLS
ncbi:hypothetical protein DFS34DRAFT_632257 [Phlyctochytrium arcticum]|nr:hypothetical protein DFS34DRAFT_632257 [Phlyctochytrium arcticum]